MFRKPPLRRVFAKNSEKTHSFSFEKTLKPIAKAVLYQKDATSDVLLAEYEGLKALIRVKNEQIERLRAQNEAQKTEYDRRIAFLTDQIAKKDARMERKDAIIQKFLDKLL